MRNCPRKDLHSATSTRYDIRGLLCLRLDSSNCSSRNSVPLCTHCLGEMLGESDTHSSHASHVARHTPGRWCELCVALCFA
jgi:hypothetical protein